jgi:3-deoxy-manno-octulosonate cytidylyltransferase (CMP-KDO synthetase)
MSAAKQTGVLVVIPARYHSRRLPGKPLIDLAGKPLIQHVVERARQATSPQRVLVATDDERIARVVADFGGEAVLTRSEHRSGTERLAEVAARISAAIYVNVQGDEPLIEPEAIDLAAGLLLAEPELGLATLATPLRDPQQLLEPSVVKVVMDFEGNALYFSRAPIPWVQNPEQSSRVRYFRHLGLYAYRRETLLEYPTLPPGELEQIEQLEQLRWLENGYRMRVAITVSEAVGVDTPADLERVRTLLATAAEKDPGSL